MIKTITMNKLNVFLAAIAFSLCFSSCETSKAPIEHLESLVEEVEDRYDEFTNKDWEKIASEYEKIEEEMSKYEFTDDELKEIGKLKGRIYAKMTKNALKDFSKQMEEISKQIEGGVEGFFEELNGD